MDNEIVVDENRRKQYTISSVINFFLFASVITVFLTNDSSERIYAIPIGGFKIIERDIFFLPLLFLFSYFNKKKIIRLLKESKLSTIVIIIFGVYFLWAIWGRINGNTIKYIGFAFRQVMYLFIYFPLTHYLLKDEKNIQKIKNLFLFLFFTTISLTIVLSIIYYGNQEINFRGMFVWIDNPNASSTFIRILTAGSLYFSFFFFLAIANFWGNRNKLVLFLSVFGLFLTYTRSYWVGAILGLLYFFLYSLRKIKLKKLFTRSLIIAVIVSCVIVFMPSFSQTITSRFLSISDSESGANSYRLIEAASFIQKIQQNLFLGSGTGSTVQTLSDFDHNDFVETPFSHNSYLIYLLYFGSIGTLFVLFSLTQPLFILKRKLLTSKNKSYLIALNASIICLLGISLTASEITFAGGYFQFGIILAFCEYFYKNNSAI